MKVQRLRRMKSISTLGTGLLAVVALAGSAGAQLPLDPDWVQFVNQTPTRLSAAAAVSTADSSEKEYAFGDLDQDGDIDLVCVRKQGWTTGGAGAFRTNVLFMNVNGVLTDQTALYAGTSDVPGDQGFLTATNDRDVQLADVTGDGWLDMITAVTLSDGFAKHISHPRVYRNLGLVGGVWGGFIHEDARIGALAGNTGSGVPHAPRFCSLATGDVDEDGDIDLYFGDYDSGPAQTLDFNDRLLLNDGNGFFTDATTTRFSGSIVVGGNAFPFPQSAFGMASHLRDINGDGHLDVIKDTALNPPQYVGVSYNNPANVGTYASHKESFPGMAPYHVSIGDLNNDNKLDIAVTDDNDDSFLLNTGNDGNGLANFSRSFFAFAPGIGGDDGFGGDSYIVDLDNDGWNDVVITDVDIDISGCNRRMHIYRNLQNAPNVTLRQENDGGAWRPTGVHDVAIFDIDGDGWLDMVIGTCTTTQVWMNVPPSALSFSYPSGRPETVGCSSTVTFPVQVLGIGGGIPETGSLELRTSIDGGPFQPQPVTSLGGDLYEVTLDGSLATSSIRYYFAAETTTGAAFSDPASAPAEAYVVSVADSIQETEQDFEGSTVGWTVANDPSLTAGGWVLVDPVGTVAAPENDAGGGADVRCWVTGNGAVGGVAGASDLDAGPTVLTSPAIDLAGSDAEISVALWFVDQTVFDDVFVVQVSGDGVVWTPVLSLSGATSTVGWTTHSFLVSDFVVPTANTRVRFIANDSPNNSLYEAGVDDFTVRRFACDLGATFRRGDANLDSGFDISDPVAFLSSQFGGGAALGCNDAADSNDDGTLNIADAVSMLSSLFSGSGPLPAPFGACGIDPTDTDALDCANTGPCP